MQFIDLFKIDFPICSHFIPAKKNDIFKFYINNYLCVYFKFL